MKNVQVYQLNNGDYCQVDQGTQGLRIEGPVTLIVLKEEDQEENQGPRQNS
ncbi:hypothetical protein M3638_01340 [Oceanobacillus profundus]|uniref:hypothetical protein n=1 Tax=Oceanobacillus profundus TaxID=372463 RepID=UPI002041D667|nr:hypothetical protein [Oceanobacillus profundus]MCM3396478.1 hypothetical protein [Oceanobacillus profundus]